MARTDLRHPANAAGDWFVDTRCIDCGTCREIAPDLFGDAGGYSFVTAQPDGGGDIDAWLAAQACPTSSIGTLSRRARPGRLYPREIESGSGVWDLGYCSEDSFGASAWLAVRPEGNVLVDSPRFTEALAGPIASMGGIAHMVLTHRDDVADAARWAERFGARTWIHHDDRSAAPAATDLIEGLGDTAISPGLVAIPVPGHTKGSVLFLLDERYLFTGDSLAWSHDRHELTAFRGACWHSWSAQTESLARLAASGHRFAWVLPGHGARIAGDPGVLHRDLVALVGRMGRR
ncbi:MAG TPA: MBL fold metallo-hydrolase [Acidimicrobiales bacterium]|jgi:glyoxylase-like metal-dependent hydrolase (beta-lactamase superfamily II)/ferredoxin